MAQIILNLEDILSRCIFHSPHSATLYSSSFCFVVYAPVYQMSLVLAQAQVLEFIAIIQHIYRCKEWTQITAFCVSFPLYFSRGAGVGAVFYSWLCSILINRWRVTGHRGYRTAWQRVSLRALTGRTPTCRFVLDTGQWNHPQIPSTASANSLMYC